MKINISLPQLMAIINKASGTAVNEKDYNDGISVLKDKVKESVEAKNQRIESLIAELSSDGFDNSKTIELLTNLKSEVKQSGDLKKEQYFDKNGQQK